MQCLCRGQAAQLQQQHSSRATASPRQLSSALHRPHGIQQVAQPLWQQQQLPQMQWQQRQQRQQRMHSTVVQAGPPEHVDTAGSKKRLAVFVSGGGSNFKAIHAACQKGLINAEVVVSCIGHALKHASSIARLATTVAAVVCAIEHSSLHWRCTQ